MLPSNLRTTTLVSHYIQLYLLPFKMSYQGAYAYSPSPQPVFNQLRYGQQTQDPAQLLSEAFPNIDRATVAVILASTKGDTVSATNALLAISGSGSASSQQQFPPNHQNAQPQMTALGPPSPALPPRASSNSQQSFAPHTPSPYVPPPHYGNDPPPATANHTIAPSQQPQYLTPIASHPGHVPTQSGPNWQNETIHATVPYQSSPNLYPTTSAPAQYNSNQRPSSPLPDIAALKLTHSNVSSTRAHSHWASCDGCGQGSIKGTRWKCVKCDDYDLCDSCKNDQVHKEHRFEEVPAGVETFVNIYCDGCGSSGRNLLGPRFICQTHKDEDYCQKCVESGRACKGPFTEVRQTSRGRQIETEGCFPMPDSWKGYLGSEVATYNVEVVSNEGGWLGEPPGINFFDVPKRVRKTKAYDPAFTIQNKTSKGHFVSDHKHSWIMKKSNGTKVFSYLLESDRKTNATKQHSFTDASGKSTCPVWRHDQQRDSLTFQNPSTGVQYRWLTNRPVSTLNDERFDFQRFALFERRGHGEIIVADFAWWDGQEDPEDCLTIRDANIDHAFVIASMNIVLEHQWRIMREQFARDPDNVRKTELKARLTRLGCATYWLASDFETATATHSSSANKWQTANHALKTANQAMDLTSAVISASSGGGGGC